MGEAVVQDIYFINGSFEKGNQKWYEEKLDNDLKLCYSLNSVLHEGTSKYQDIALLDTKHFGKALLIDGKMQSTEMDEFIYHECLIHPALLCHPKRGGFLLSPSDCKQGRLRERDALPRHQRCKREEIYDIIVGDLADPMEGGPCYQLYTKSFYEKVLKPKLQCHGIFVTQAGPAGVLTHKEVFSSIYNTLKHVFKYVIAYTAHVPSFVDTWGWVMASDQPFVLNAQLINKRIGERINGDLLYLNGESLVSSTVMNKSVHQSLLEETHECTEENARYIHGQGRAWCA